MTNHDVIPTPDKAVGGSSIERGNRARQIDRGELRELAFDLDGILAIGVDRWRQNYMWPVTDAEFEGIFDLVWMAFDRGAQGLDGVEKDIWLADHGMAAFLVQHLHLALAAMRARSIGAELRYGDITRNVLVPGWPALGKALDRRLAAAKPFRFGLRSLAKNLVFNKHLGIARRLRALFGCPHVWSLGTWSELKQEYAARAGKAVRHLYWDQLVEGARNDGSVPPRIVKAARVFLASVADEIGAQLGLKLDTEAATTSAIARYATLSSIFTAIEQCRLPEIILLTQSGNPFHRAICLAALRRGTEVVGFVHGHRFASQPNLGFAIVDLVPCDRFAVTTQKAVEYFVANAKVSQLSNHASAKIESLDSNRYARLRASFAEIRPKSPVRSVMIIGYSPSWLRFPSFVAHYSVIQLDLEIRLADVLRSGGYRVLYKAHPEWAEVQRPLFAERVDEYLIGEFRDQFQAADALLFPRITTTAFGVALCTNHPIVVLDPVGQRWNPEARALLSRRCRFVGAHVDPDNRLQFAEDELLQAMGAEDKGIDFAFVEQVMCP